MPIVQDTIRDLKADTRVVRKMRMTWWGMLSFACVALPIVWLFDRYGELRLFLPFLDGTVVVGLAVVLKWQFRRCAWFWVAMMVITTLHVTLILLVPWPERWVPAAVWAGWAALELYLVLAVISLARQATGTPRSGRIVRTSTDSAQMGKPPGEDLNKKMLSDGVFAAYVGAVVVAVRAIGEGSARGSLLAVIGRVALGATIGFTLSMTIDWMVFHSRNTRGQ